MEQIRLIYQILLYLFIRFAFIDEIFHFIFPADCFADEIPLQTFYLRIAFL